MLRNREDNLSYIIRIDGDVVPAMPDAEEFSPQQIRDYVAGPPRVACLTPDGYALFQSTDAISKDFPVNEVATLICKSSGASDSVRGRAFLGHPAHIPAFWKTLPNETDSQRR